MLHTYQPKVIEIETWRHGDRKRNIARISFPDQEGVEKRDLRQRYGQRQKLTLSIEIRVSRTRIEKLGLGRPRISCLRMEGV